MDNLEKDLLAKGFEIAFDAKIREENNPTDKHNIYPNIKQLHNSIKFLGFNEEFLIRLRYENNAYVATVYIKNSIG